MASRCSERFSPGRCMTKICSSGPPSWPSSSGPRCSRCSRSPSGMDSGEAAAAYDSGMLDAIAKGSGGVYGGILSTILVIQHGFGFAMGVAGFMAIVAGVIIVPLKFAPPVWHAGIRAAGGEGAGGRKPIMYVTNGKRLTNEGARKMMAAAISKAKEAGIAVSIAIADAGGHLILFERMEGGRFHSVHSATVKAVCAASNRRPTSSRGAQAQQLDVVHALGLALAAGPERSYRDGRRLSDHRGGRMHRRHRRRRRRLGHPRAHRATGGGSDRLEPWRLRSWRCLHRFGLVVRRAGRRGQAFGQAQDRRVLFPLGGKARRLRRQIRFPRRELPSYLCFSPTRTSRRSRRPRPTARSSQQPRARGPRRASTSFSTSPSPPRLRHGRAILPKSAARPAWCWPLGYQRRRESQFRWIKRRIEDGLFGRKLGQRGSQDQPRPARQDRSRLVALPGSRERRAG